MTNPIRFALALPLCILALALSLLGCGSTIPHQLAIVAAPLGHEMRALETAEGDAAIDRIHAAGGTRDDATSELARVEARWQPFFAAWRAFLAADALWLEALKAGGTGDYSALIGAACKMAAAGKALAPEAVAPLLGVVAGVCP